MTVDRGAARNRARQAVRRTGRWVSRRRRAAADQFLRGVSYGAGTTVTSLFVVWVQTRR